MFLHFPSIISLLSTSGGSDLSAAFHNSICKWALGTCNARFASDGERFQWRRVPPVSVDFMPGSIQRGGFFLIVEGQIEAVLVVSRSLRVSVVTIPDFAMRYVSRYLGHDAIRIAILVYRVSQSLDLQFVYDGSAIYRPRYTLPNHHNRCRMCWSLAVA